MPKSKEEYRKQYWKGRKASRDQVRDIAKILDANETDASKSFAYVLSKYFEEEGDVNVEQEDRYNSAIYVLNGEESTYGEEADLRKTVAKQLRSKARGHGGFSTICDILRLNDAYRAWLEEHAPTDPLVQELSRFLDEKSADKEAWITPVSNDNNREELIIDEERSRGEGFEKEFDLITIDDLSESQGDRMNKSCEESASLSLESNENKIASVSKQNCTLNDLESSFGSKVRSCHSAPALTPSPRFKEEDFGSFPARALTPRFKGKNLDSLISFNISEQTSSDVLQYTYSKSANSRSDIS